jgi:hypothetical protein
MKEVMISWAHNSNGRKINTKPIGKLRQDDNIKIHIREVICEDGWCMELAQNNAQWQTLAVLSLHILPLES